MTNNMGKVGAAFLVLSAFLIIAAATYAHQTGGSFEQKDGDYLIDVGYTPENFESGSAEVFDFNIKDAAGESVPFDDIWVRIDKDGQTLLAAGVAKPAIGTTLLTYVFPAPGEYTLNMRFQREGSALANASFPVAVAWGQGSQGGGVALWWVVVAAALGLSGGLFVALAVVKRKR